MRVTTTSLDRAPTGAPLVVREVDGPAPLVRRLAELGLRPSAVVTVVHRTSGRGRVLDVAGSRIALADAVLRSIRTEPQG
jgi:ferrous iron transport protein A